MFCRDFRGNIAARDDGKPGTERVPQNRSKRNNVYILPSVQQRKYVDGVERLLLTWAAASMIVAI